MRRPNQGPRISVNKLGEYIVSRAGRQNTILRQQKFPPDFITTYYRDAQEAIAQFIASGLEDSSILDRKIESLDQLPAGTVHQARRNAGNIEAIESFQNLIDDINLHGGTPRLGENAPERLVIRGVEISVRPEIIVVGRGRGRNLIGGMKLHFPKTNPLSEEAAGYVSAVMQRYHRDCMPDDGEPHARYCSVIDVASGRVYGGVQSTAARMRDVENACDQIAALWPNVQP